MGFQGEERKKKRPGYGKSRQSFDKIRTTDGSSGVTEKKA